MAIIAPEISINEFITGEKFELLCDVDAEKDKNYINTIKGCRNHVITLFTQTHELVNRIPEITKINKRFIIVTHNSDGNLRYSPVTRKFDYQWKNEPNIIHWFSQNVDVDEINVTPIPIAVENAYVFQPEQKQQYMINCRQLGLKKEIRMFICYNPETNPNERKPPLTKFKKSDWVTIVDGYNNINLVKPYFDTMVKCNFVLCPDGNGMDTIRLWEALYLGCIPIVKPHVFTKFFAEQLPILIVDSWDEITLKFLLKKFKEFDSRSYNWEILKISYWKKIIMEMKEREECCLNRK